MKTRVTTTVLHELWWLDKLEEYMWRKARGEPEHTKYVEIAHQWRAVDPKEWEHHR